MVSRRGSESVSYCPLCGICIRGKGKIPHQLLEMIAEHQGQHNVCVKVARKDQQLSEVIRRSYFMLIRRRQLRNKSPKVRQQQFISCEVLLFR